MRGPQGKHGAFERRPWGVIWLMDGPGAAATRTPVIIHDAPLNETDGAHLLGGQQIAWKFLRRSTTPGDPSDGLSAVRRRILQVCAEIFPQNISGLIHLTSQRRQPGSKVANCGAFSGMVLGCVPVIPSTGRGRRVRQQARLKGWVDLDNLYAVAKESFPNDLG
ncbi:MAG: hypothetical protein IT165_18265 [Bryobacterales bacterium]|nr:hypothetical protein [Bryobacterales bacterium]